METILIVPYMGVVFPFLELTLFNVIMILSTSVDPRSSIALSTGAHLNYNVQITTYLEHRLSLTMNKQTP